MRRYVFPVLLGIAGIAVLVGLGVWQLQRLEWKTAILTDIETRIAADPVPLPQRPDPEADRYLPVMAQGRLPGDELHILTSTEATGAGYRVIAAVETDGRRVMADLGVVPMDAKEAVRAGEVALRGNLHWPQESDSFTPEPDLDRNIWFARDVDAMAAALEAEPLLIVARDIDPPVGTYVQPVGTEGISNDHLEYAITWFGLALVWAGMSVFLIRRTAQAGREE